MLGTRVVIGHYQMALAWGTDIVCVRRGARGQLDRRGCDIFIGNHAQYMPEAVQTGAPLVVRLDLVPARFGYVGVVEHDILGFGELYPPAARLDIYRAELPAL